MMKHTGDSRTIEGAALTRTDLATMGERGSALHVHLIDCDLDKADLSGLDLSGWQFERCNFRHASLKGAQLEHSQWRSCRGPFE